MTSGHDPLPKKREPKIIPPDPAEIIAIHGFLGLAKDWSSFGFTAIDFWQNARALADTPDAFAAWASRFNDRFMAGRSDNVFKPWLLGYSLGGRLAMHAVLAHPELYSGAIFVSTNPGLESEADRATRLASDLAWAARFRADQWSTVVNDWNAQPVLAAATGSPGRLERKISDFDRASLASALDIWSLGRQADLRSQLAQLAIPVLYLTGEQDTKFTSLISALALPAGHQQTVIPGAGHRLPWDRPREFAEAVKKFTIQR
jgi:2-succinyl-6-hydroxy-2,4-cyclohexadiene-1-carboxylate synthase